MTIIGTIERQKSVLRGFGIFLVWAICTAGYSQTIPFSVSPTNSHIPLIQQASRGVTPSPTSVVWPSSVSYKRMVDFVKPFLQPNLALGIEYNYNFTFSLSAKSQIHGAAVPDGWYLLELAVVLPNDELSPALKVAGLPQHTSVYDRYVTSRSLFVQVVNHTLTKRIPLVFPNLSATTLMSHLYIELTPLQTACANELPSGQRGDGQCIHSLPNGEADARNSTIVPLPHFKPYLIDMPFVPYRSQDSASGDADENQQAFTGDSQDNLSTYIAKAKQIRAAARLAAPPKPSPQEYAAQHHLVYMSIHDPSLRDYANFFSKGHRAEDVLGPVLNGNAFGTLQLNEAQQNFMPILCYALAYHNEHYSREYLYGSQYPQNFRLFLGYYMTKCLREPGDVVSVSRRIHINRFDSKSVRASLSQSLSFSLQNNFLLSRSHSVDTFDSVGNNLQFKPLDIFGFQATLSRSYQVVTTNGRTQSESQSGSLGLPIDFNMIGMTFTATDSQRCLEVLAHPGPQSPLYDDRKNAPHNGVYICDDESTAPSSVSEIYGHIFVNHAETSLVDTFSALNQSLNLTLQGDSDLSAFYYQLRQGMSADAASHLGPFRLLEKGRGNFLAHASEPSVVTTPIQFADQNPQSLSALAFGTYSESFVDNR